MYARLTLLVASDNTPGIDQNLSAIACYECSDGLTCKSPFSCPSEARVQRSCTSVNSRQSVPILGPQLPMMRTEIRRQRPPFLEIVQELLKSHPRYDVLREVGTIKTANVSQRHFPADLVRSSYTPV